MSCAVMSWAVMSWAVVTWVGAGQSFFLAAVLLTRRSRVARWLAALVAAVGWILAEEGLDRAGALAVETSVAAELLLGPLILLLARAIADPDRTPSRRDALHFVPFAVAEAYVLLSHPTPPDERLLLVKGPILFGYLVTTWHAISTPRQSPMLRAARRVVAALVLLGTATFLLFHLERLGLDLDLDSDRIAGLGLTVTLHAAAFAALRPGTTWAEAPTAAAPTVGAPTARPYATSPLGTATKQELGAAVVRCLETERPWLNPELSLDELAAVCRMPAHHLSEILSTELEGSFYEVVARYRVAEACRLLNDPSWADRSVLDVGYEAGFNSKASFHRAFRRETATTPAAFRSRHIASQSAD